MISAEDGDGLALTDGSLAVRLTFPACSTAGKFASVTVTLNLPFCCVLVVRLRRLSCELGDDVSPADVLSHEELEDVKSSGKLQPLEGFLRCPFWGCSSGSGGAMGGTAALALAHRSPNGGRLASKWFFT